MADVSPSKTVPILKMLAATEIKMLATILVSLQGTSLEHVAEETTSALKMRSVSTETAKSWAARAKCAQKTVNARLH